MSLSEKERTIPQMFNAISSRYDLINIFLSFGLDKYWRKAVCRHLPQKQYLKLLDCATGTGDQLIALLKHGSIYDAVGIDPAEEMLAKASPKIAPYAHCVQLIAASAEKIPYPVNTFDVATMTFGIRNVRDPQQSLKELYRVLSPSGRLLILEFSAPAYAPLRFLHRGYLNHIVPTIGGLLSKNRDAYSYLSKTIQAFPQGESFCALLREAGFENLRAIPLSFGIVTLYVGDKP